MLRLDGRRKKALPDGQYPPNSTWAERVCYDYDYRGMSQLALAATYGVSRLQIRNALQGELEDGKPRKNGRPPNLRFAKDALIGFVKHCQETSHVATARSAASAVRRISRLSDDVAVVPSAGQNALMRPCCRKIVTLSFILTRFAPPHAADVRETLRQASE